MRISKGIYTPSALRLISHELQRTSSELHSLAKLLEDAQIDHVEISRAQGMEDALRWSKQFADCGHREYFAIITQRRTAPKRPAPKANRSKK